MRDAKRMMPPEGDLRTFDGLRRLVAALRGPEGCPWDREQTHDSLKPYLLEEASEAVEALDERDLRHLTEELGDLLLQVLMHSQIAEESGEFTLEDIIHGIATKLIRRHPHVFGDMHLGSAQEVAYHWEHLKRAERGPRDSALQGVPNPLPALARAQALQRRAAAAGFAWQDDAQAKAKLSEELGELESAGTKEEQLHEFGDALFALVQLAQRMALDSEEALRLACGRFTDRFQRMESQLKARVQTFQDVTLEEKLSLWQETRTEQR